MKMYNDILGPVPDDDNEASFLLLDAIADERGDARISATLVSYGKEALGNDITYTALRTILCISYSI